MFEIMYYLVSVNEIGVSVTLLLSKILIRSSNSNSNNEIVSNLLFIKCMDRSLVEVAFWGKFVLKIRMAAAFIGAIAIAILPRFLFK